MTAAGCKLCQRYADVDYWGHCSTCAELNPSRVRRWGWLDWAVCLGMVGAFILIIWSLS